MRRFGRRREREREKKNYNYIITSKNPQTKCLCIGKIQKKTFLHFKFHCYTFEPNRFNKNQQYHLFLDLFSTFNLLLLSSLYRITSTFSQKLLNFSKTCLLYLPDIYSVWFSSLQKIITLKFSTQKNFSSGCFCFVTKHEDSTTV